MSLDTRTRTDHGTAADQAWSLPAKAGAAGIATFAAASVAVGLLNPDYQPLREGISALAALDSDFAVVMIAGFLAAGTGLAAAGIGLWRRFAGVTSGRIGAAMVTLAGPLMMVAGLARQDCSERLESCIDHGEGTLASGHFWVHQYVSLLMFVLLTASLFVLARGLRKRPGLTRLAVPVRLAGAFGVLSIAELIADPAFLNDYAGLVQRLFLVAIFVTPVLAAGLPARRRS